MRLAIRASDVLFCQSQEAAELLHDLLGTSRQKIIVVPNWIDSRSYSDIAAARTDRMPDRPPVVLYLSWLVRYKGIFTLAEAVAQLHKRGRMVRLVYAGSGPQAAELAERCRELGLGEVAELRGWVDGQQKRAAYLEADVFVLASEREGMPNSVLEAMASAVPVVVSPVGGLPSLVVDGENSLLVEPNAVGQLADAIERVLWDPSLARRLGEQGRASVQAEHDISALWPKVLAALTGENPNQPRAKGEGAAGE